MSLALCPGAVSEDALKENERTAPGEPEASALTRGFSLVEVLVVVALAMTIAGMIVVHLTPTLQPFRVQLRILASNRCVPSGPRVRHHLPPLRANHFSQLCRQRDQPNNQIAITVKQQPDTDRQSTGRPSDDRHAFGQRQLPASRRRARYPDAFGNATAVNFAGTDGGPTTGMLLPGGRHVRESGGANLNGSVFLGQNRPVSTARAVTVLGTTGRIRAYHINGAGTDWFEKR